MPFSKWDNYFMGVAKLTAAMSKDPSTKCGAVVVDGRNRIVSVGFNGFPHGVGDDGRLDNREAKYKIILHAEDNAILYANKPLGNHKIFVWPFAPCPQCASKIIQVGINEVVYGNVIWPDRLIEDFQYSLNYLRSSAVVVRMYTEPDSVGLACL